MKIFSIKPLLFLLIVLNACGQKGVEQKKGENANETSVSPDSAQLAHAGLQLGSVTNMRLASHIRVNGRIDVPPQNMVSVSMPLGGYLKSTALLPGMHITKGEVIAVMED